MSGQNLTNIVNRESGRISMPLAVAQATFIGTGCYLLDYNLEKKDFFTILTAPIYPFAIAIGAILIKQGYDRIRRNMVR